MSQSSLSLGSNGSPAGNGKVVQVIGPVVDVEFADGKLPKILNALKLSNPGISDGQGQPHARGRAAPRREHRPRDRHGHDRRPRARDGGPRHRRAHRHAGRPGVPRAHPQRHRRAGRRRAPRRDQDAHADPPGAAARSSSSRRRSRSSRPASRSSTCSPPTARAARSASSAAPASARPCSSGAHQQRRQGARRRVVLRRRRRAHARGQRPLHRDDARSKLAVGRRPVISKTALVYGQMNEPPGARARVALSRAHGRRVLPRRGEAGRPPLRRQHLPLHAGRLGSVRAPRPHPERRRLPADAVDRDGRPPGAHHVDEQGLDHQRPGHLRPRRRPDRPRARDGVRPPRRDDGSQPRARPRSASTRPSTRSTRPVDAARSRRSSASATTTSRAACRRRCRSTRICRTSSPSSAWTSSARTTSSSSPARARSSASCRSRSSSPRSSPASPGKQVPLKETIDGFERDRRRQVDDDLPEQAFYMVGNIEEAKVKAAELTRRRPDGDEAQTDGRTRSSSRS